MDELIRRFVKTGIVFANRAAERVETVVDELIDQGKLSEDEGSKIVNNLLSDAKKNRTKFEGKAKDFYEQMRDKLDIPSNDDFEKLKKKMKKLEKRLAKLEGISEEE